MRATGGPERRRRRRESIEAESADGRQEPQHFAPQPDFGRLREGVAGALKSDALRQIIQAAIDEARAGGRPLTPEQIDLLETMVASPLDEDLAVVAVYGLLGHDRPFSRKTAAAIVAIFRAITTFAPDLAAECVRLKFPQAAVEIDPK